MPPSALPLPLPTDPSSLTETAASVLFKTGYGILIALFCIILLYSVGLLCWFRYHSVPLVNFRGYLLAAITVFCLCALPRERARTHIGKRFALTACRLRFAARIILHSCSPVRRCCFFSFFFLSFFLFY